MDIDAVEQRPADLAEILLDLARRAAALARAVPEEATFAPVQLAIGLLNGSTDRQPAAKQPNDSSRKSH